MDAVLLIGHGSLRRGSGAAMIRLAARARAAGVAPIVEAGFLNYSQPRFAHALARCIAQGASEVVIQPYFLIPGKFVGVVLPRVLEAARATHPAVMLQLAAPFGDHPAMADLVLKRAAASPPQMLGRAGGQALLLMAHGSPSPAANQPIEAIAERIRMSGLYAHVTIGYMELNQPSIADALDDLVARGVERVVAVPYFLQLGGHVAEDLPAAIAAAQQRHTGTPIVMAEHLAYDELLVQVIADRAAATRPPVE